MVCKIKFSIPRKHTPQKIVNFKFSNRENKMEKIGLIQGRPRF
ncbi:hypothetical protein pah_c026o131 [Parachlamydia acanthamoebae str. Hall's coccus]|nr:hypothetical protein pah_c026o131 [Parachlamydia acanthamoebae str. Hall's coccus]